MSKAKQVFLILVVVVVLTIVAVLGITSRSGPVALQEPFQYSETQAEERLETLKAAQNKHVVEVIPMKFFVDEIRQDDGTFTVTAVTTMPEEDIAAVSFRATASADPDLEKWYDAEKTGIGRYQVSGSAVDLGRRSGTYTVEAFITPTGGSETEAGKTEIDMDLTNYFYSEALGEGRQSLILVGPKTSGDDEVKGVLFKVWSVDDDQDDIKTYTAKEESKGVWTAAIDVHDFDGKGDFIANAYAVLEEEITVSGSSAEKSSAGGTAGTNETEISSSADASSVSASSVDASSADASSVSASSVDASSAAPAGTNATGTKEDSASSSSEVPEEEEPPAIGIASERFELLPEPMDLPEGAGEVVDEGKRVYVKVPELLQTPELPTGCESVALTIALQSYGFELGKTDIAKNYLAYGTDMATSYVGDPYSAKGAGCFPPAIVAAANKYLKEQGDKRVAHNITGTSIDDLCEYIENGLPVILWSSMYMASPDKTGGSYTYQGKTYQWYRSEHCVVLYGYDKAKDVYLVSDPLVGLVERDATAFQSIYDKIGKYAVIIY